MSESVEQFLAPYASEVREIALRLRQLILAVFPDAVELVDPPSKIIGYGWNATYAGLACAIAPYKSHVNLMFSRGASLDDPEKLLAGTGKLARHVRFETPAEVDRPGVRALLEIATRLEECEERQPGEG